MERLPWRQAQSNNCYLYRHELLDLWSISQQPAYQMSYLSPVNISPQFDKKNGALYDVQTLMSSSRYH